MLTGIDEVGNLPSQECKRKGFVPHAPDMASGNELDMSKATDRTTIYNNKAYFRILPISDILWMHVLIQTVIVRQTPNPLI